MDRCTKDFVVNSPVCLVAASSLGIWMGGGEACFSCPGQATESIRQNAMTHNVDEKVLLQELNDSARSG